MQPKQSKWESALKRIKKEINNECDNLNSQDEQILLEELDSYLTELLYNGEGNDEE